MSSHPPNKWLTLTPEVRAPSVPQQETNDPPQSSVTKSYTARHMSSHPANKWLQLTPEPQTTSTPQRETNRTQIPFTESRATTTSLSNPEALNETSKAEEADNAPDAKKAALQKDTQIITEQMSKLKALAKLVQPLRGLEENDDEEIVWVFEQLSESAKGRPERIA